MGSTTNVEVVDGKTNMDIVFRAAQDIDAGEELFVDYGSNYDRTSYRSEK